MRQIALLALFTAIYATPAYSSTDPEGDGPGLHTCLQFSSDTSTEPAAEDKYFTWAQGLMTGLNIAYLAARVDTADLGSKSISAQKEAIREYCKANPNDPYFTAVMALYGSLKALKDRHPE